MFKETFILQSIYKLWSRTRCQPQFQTLHSQQGWRRSAPPDRAPVVHPPLRQISRTTEGCSESDKYHHSFLKELVGEEWHGGQPDETEYKKKEKRNNSGSDTCTGGGGQHCFGFKTCVKVTLVDVSPSGGWYLNPWETILPTAGKLSQRIKFNIIKPHSQCTSSI